MTAAPTSAPPRFAIVTGAGAGIGAATVRILAKDGWRVGAFDINHAALRALAPVVGSDSLFTHRIDVTDEAAWQAAVAEFSAWSGGRLNLLVNNAGTIEVGPFAEIGVARMRRMVEINVMGVITGTHACLGLLAATPGARIINVSSIASLSGWPYAAAYSATKSAVGALTEALAVELASRGIAVCDVLPSFVGTQLVGSDREVEAVRRSFKAYSIAFSQPSRVAKRIVAAINGRGIHHVVGKQARFYQIVTGHFPGLGRALSRMLARKYAQTAQSLRASESRAPVANEPPAPPPASTRKPPR